MDDLKKRLESLEDFFSKSRKLSDADTKKKIDEYKQLRSEIELNDQLDETTKNKYTDRLNKLNNNISKTYGNLKSEAGETESIFDGIFEGLEKGLNANNAKVGNFTDAVHDLNDVFFDLGSNLKFWRDYDRRIREVGASYGLTNYRIEEFRSSNKNLEKQIIGLGLESEDLKFAIEGLYDKTKQTNQITEDFVDTIGGMTAAMGIGASEAGGYIGMFKELNVSYKETGKILNDLRNMALKAGLNTGEVLKTFTKEFEKLNTYSFKNGVQGMMDMVKQSTALKINMDSVLALSDKFTDPESTMEFASNMQLLGGSFAQLGDFNKLMYDAAVAPEELAKNIAKASASLGSFDRETGKFSIGFADRLQLDAAGKQLGMTRAEMNKMATQMAKINDMKMSINLKPLSEDAYNTLSTLADFDPSRGEYIVKFKDEKGEEIVKSIAELDEKDIEKIANVKETESLKEVAAQKLDAIDATVNNMKVLKYDAPDFFKSVGGLSDDLKNSLSSFEGKLVEKVDSLKKNVFEPMEGFLGKFIGGQLSKGLDNASEAIDILSTDFEKLLKEIKDSDIFKTLSAEFQDFVNKALASIAKNKPATTTGPTTTPVKEVGRLGGILEIQKFAEGNILKGLSHEEGGIPFSIKGQKGFEAEGGEVLLSKGVSEDPILLSLASKINEAGGGKKLFEDGGTLDYSSPIKDKGQSLVNNSQIMRINNENINNISNLQSRISNDFTQQTKESDILSSNMENITNNTSEILNKYKVITSQNFTDLTKTPDFLPKNLNTKELSDYIQGTKQGGLVEKRMDNDLKSIPVNGSVNVGGKIEFGTLKVSIDGTTKDIKIDESMKDKIIAEISNSINTKIKNTNVYVHNDIAKKGTNVNEGKKPVMHGINEGVDGGVGSWFV